MNLNLLKLCSLVLIGVFFMPEKAEAKGPTYRYLCLECTSYNVAKNKAIGFAAPRECSGDVGNGGPIFNENYTCWRANRRNVMVGLNAQWAFEVGSDDGASIFAKNVSSSISSKERTAGNKTVRLFLQYKRAIENMNISSFQSNSFDINQYSIMQSDDCPSKTVLDYLTNSTMLAQAKQFKKAGLEDKLRGLWGGGDCLNAVSRGAGLSLSVLSAGINYSHQLSRGGRPIISGYKSPNELGDKASDELMFNMEVRCRTNGSFDVKPTVSNESTILGQKGYSNPYKALAKKLKAYQKVDKHIPACLADKMEKLYAEGKIKLGETRVSSGGFPSNSSSPGGGWTGVVGGGAICEREAFINGISIGMVQSRCG